MFWHLLHNWSAVAVTVLGVWAWPDRAVAAQLALANVAAIGVVWGWFNWQHRRINRLQNLGLTTLIGLTFAAAGWYGLS